MGGARALASAAFSSITKHIDALFRTGTAMGVTDGSLLDRFRCGQADEAEAAFTVLVERHGPMVQHVCRRILGDRHDAEDAAQAVFLVLSRQAHSIRRTDSVANWLYGVATRVATRARLDAARRRLRERKGAERSMAIRDFDHGGQDGSECWPDLYQEVGRLPDRFRLPILLCHLEGLTHEQAAERLGCPVRTIQSRLARGRERLRDRLTRRGVAPAITALAPDAARAAVSESWKQATVTAAVRYAAGGSAAALIPSTAAVLLAQGASRAMILHRLMMWAAALLMIGLAVGGAGMGMLTRPAPPESERLAPAQPKSIVASNAQKAAPSEPERLAPAQPGDNRYRVTMGGGTTFEVVALSRHFSSPKTWWRPDGTLLAEAPADPSQRVPFGKEGEELLYILVRLKGLPENSTLKWVPTYDEECISYGGSGVAKDGQPAPELRAYIVSVRPVRTTGSVRIQFAAGPWKTESSDSGRAYYNGVPVIKDGHKFYFGKARPYWYNGGATTIAVAHNLVDANLHLRLVAVDRQGKEHQPSYYADADARTSHSFVNHFGTEHPADYSSEATGEIFSMLDTEFSLPFDQIQEFRVQSRPFERAEINDIALQPRPAAK
jgi:RNA polymerase sigma factor (sigma-70 family)